MKKLLALLLALAVSSVSADETANLITSTWSGATVGTIGANYMPAGSTSAPRYEPSTNTFQFSYGQATVSQTIAINNALANVGAGVQINGYRYSYELRNMNGDDRQTGVDSITINTAMKNAAGATLLSGTEVFNTKFDWTPVSGVRTAQTPYQLNEVNTLSFSATSKDSGFWAGYFGPQVRNVDMRLNYTVDPCVTNPAYSPTCANYNTVSISNNLVPNPTGYATFGASIDQSYAINQALQQSGAGVMIHGFQWGYVANANGPYCSAWDFLGCWGTIITPSVSTNVNITDANGSSIYSINRTYTNSYNTTNYQYILPSSRNLATLGRFNFTATTNDAAYVGDMWSKALYTPDPCTVNPLSSTSCPLYQQAFLEQQCASNPLYSTQCSGYAVAYFNQQCSANALYNPSCPGYATAYLNYQCSINPLYATTCAGYETAYFNQQCSLDPLYNSRCPGYATAYESQQCSLNPLYSTTCSGYADAYFVQQCRLNPLYDSGCTGYQAAYLTQQCNANPLYSTSCSGYQAAYKSQQCSANPLYATDCPGYAAAYKAQQCSANPLYATDCPGYLVAYKAQQCSLNALFATDCPGYAEAYKAQQCNLNGLYDKTCPNYAEAYAKKMLLEQQGLASTVATAGVVASTAPSTTNVDSSTGTVSSTPSTTGSTVVDKALPPPATSANSSAAPAAPVQLVQQPKMETAAPQASREERKPEAAPQGGQPPQQAQSPQGEKPQPTNRQALAERRMEAAKKEAVAKGNNLAKEMGKVADMEAQKQVQNVVIQAMGFTPGFDAYGKSFVPDGVSYKPFTVYAKQVTVDNVRLGRRLYGPSDRLHDELVESQYKGN